MLAHQRDLQALARPRLAVAAHARELEACAGVAVGAVRVVEQRTHAHQRVGGPHHPLDRSEEHTSELQSLMRISYAVFCLKKKKQKTQTHTTYTYNTNHMANDTINTIKYNI